MYNVSTEFKNKIKQNSRRIAGKLLLGKLELTPEDIINMDMEYSLGNDGIPAIGGAVASKLEVKLFRDKLPPVLTTQELKPYLGIKVSPGAIEYVPMGVFRISPKDTIKTDKTITLVGYDILFLLENSPYNSKLKFPNTLNNIKTELETKGLKFASQTLTNVTIKEKPNTIRELLSDVSELLGMNVVTNKLGEIEFRQLNVVEFDLDANNYYDFKLLADDDVKLTRLTVEKEGEENKDLTYGDDTGYTIKIKNDSINTQSELRTAYDRVFPLSYTAYECNMQGMPHIEVGDIINLTDRHGIERNIPIAYHRMSYSGGLRSEIRANAPSGAISSTGSTGSNSITQSLNDLRVNILEVNTVLADKVSTNELDANVARIEKIINTDLEAVNARIDTIYTNDLTAINAHITALKGNVAEIDTILSKEVFVELASVGQIVAGSGIIADGAIGDAQISSLDANKIMSGMIDTFKVTILGPDGRMKISGNKLQIFDDDGFGGLQERIFLGVDDLNNSALTLRGPDGQTILLTQDGLTDVGFTDGYNKLDDNSLDPKKIDIQKVVTRINESTETIQASKIIIDNTTLDLSFNTIKNTVTSQGEEISNQRSEINALDDAIKLKVDNQTFNQYRTTNDGNITTINTQLSKNTASIDVLQEEIALKVSQTEVEKLVNNLEIGGRNLIKNSGNFTTLEGWSSHNSISIVEKDGFPVITGTSNANSSTQLQHINPILLEPNSTYTYSVEIMFDQDVVQNLTRPVHYHWNSGDSTQGARTEIKLISGGVIPANTWFKVILQTTTKASLPKGSFFRPFIYGLDEGITYWLKNMKLEKGNKATDWTPALEDIENEITAINTKVAGIDITLNSIKERVSSTESNIVKINNEVSVIESRVSSAERKITDDAIVDTVRSSTAYKGDLNTITNQVTTVEQLANQLEVNVKDYTDGKLSGATYTFDGNYATFEGAGLRIRNRYGTDVLKGDTNGDLEMSGKFSTFDLTTGKKAIGMGGTKIDLYDWVDSKRAEPVGNIYATRTNGDSSKPGLAICSEKGSHISLVYRADDGRRYSYVDFDKDEILDTTVSQYPITFWKRPLFLDDARFKRGLTLGTRSFRNQIYSSTSDSMVINFNSAQGTGIQLRRVDGTLVSWYYPGTSYPFQFGHSVLMDMYLKVNGNFSVVGSKNALHETDNYGDRLISAYETAEYYFGDIGSGLIGEDGLCYIHIDEILQECINSTMRYHVFLQKCGKGDIWIKERYPNFFIVEGSPGLEFSWELKAKRKGYEHHRLETPYEEEPVMPSIFDEELTNTENINETQDVLMDSLNDDLTNLLLREAI